MSYTLAINHKAFADNDTFNHVAQIELVRDLSDSLFGGICTIDMDSIWYGYDGHHILRASPGEGTLLVVDATEHPMFYIKGSLVDNFVDYGFLKLSQGLKNYLQEPDISVTFSDTMIGHWPCLGILFKLPDQEDITDQTFFIAIDTIEYHFRNKVYSAYFQGNQQYTNWDYKQVQYGHNTHIEKLQEANLAKFNNIVQYESDTAKQETLNEFDFKLLTGRVLTKDESFRIIDVHAKYTILDFWYSSCYPCIKSIPAVNQIYQGYKDKGVMVCGVNPVDDPIKSKTRLDKFLLNNPMGYETIMVDKQIGQSVCAAGYPTFIILDHNYKVVYKETGYNENLYNEVSAFLDDALKQSK
jgi:thiol-disulfide isomerase/thioredoxin